VAGVGHAEAVAALHRGPLVAIRHEPPYLPITLAGVAGAVLGLCLALMWPEVRQAVLLPPVTPAVTGPVTPAPAPAPLVVTPPAPRKPESWEAEFLPLPPRNQQIVMAGQGNLPLVALTFDACSTHRFVGWDPRVADILERYQVPATFFLGGRFMDTYPDVVETLAQNPLFDLQGHTYFHPHMNDLTPRKVVDELASTDWALWRAVGRRAVLFRPPFGEYSTEVVKTATAAGYLPIQYDIASGDPDPGFHASRLLESLLTQVRPGSIVVLHANGYGFHTPEALPLVIDALRGRGFELTTVSDMLARDGWVVDDGRKGRSYPKSRPPPPPPPPDANGAPGPEVASSAEVVEPPAESPGPAAGSPAMEMP
jgi:peptidoglycan/xylan/chitin deacetylase (PgdA/CDA1 family)